MNLKTLKNFLKDTLLFALFFYGAVILLLIFFYLELDGNIDIIYPLLLSGLVHLIFTLIKFANYIRFDFVLNALKSGTQGDDIKCFGLDHQQQNAIDILKEAKRASIEKEHQIQLKNDEKYKIISQIVHNIKTPSSVIDLTVQNSKESGEHNAEILTKIDKENRIIDENLDQILSYLRLDYFHNDYMIEEVNLVSQLREKINLRRERFIYNNVYPKMMIDSQEIYVLTDKKWNGIILEQIISNAIKYTSVKEEGFITFKITKKQAKIVLEIEDNGIGIPPSDLKRIFEPFFTGENGRKVKTASGIGLYICQKISRELNHKIEVTSTVEKGTKVVITYLTKM